MVASKIECGFMEDFVEDIQQQNTQEEQQAAQVTEEQTETVEAAPSEEDLEVIETLIGDSLKEAKEIHDLGNEYDGGYPEIDPVDTLEEAADYRKRLTACPECGDEHSLDQTTSFCLNCGFM